MSACCLDDPNFQKKRSGGVEEKEIRGGESSKMIIRDDDGEKRRRRIRCTDSECIQQKKCMMSMKSFFFARDGWRGRDKNS